MMMEELGRLGRGLVRAECFVVIAALLAAFAGWYFFRTLPVEEQNFERAARVIELGLLAVGLTSLLLLFQQNQQSRRWNKVLSYHQFFGELVSDEMASRLQRTIDACDASEQVGQNLPITPASAGLMSNSDEHRQAVSSYLDEFEEFAGAVNAGVVDEVYAYNLEATRVIRVWGVYRPYIEARRATFTNARFYLELEMLSDRWSKRRDKTIAKANKAAGMKNHV